MTMTLHTSRVQALVQLVAALFLVFPAAAIAQQSSEAPATPVSVPTLVSTAGPAVVTISTTKGAEPLALGSGFNVDTMGVIITNYHVVKGANEVSVKFPNGDRFRVEGLIAIDRDKDIAILKISGFDLPTLSLGNSTQFQIGEQAVAIGSPQGFESTVSTGIISGRRQLPYMWLIQTTAPISPGSSGGPLFGADGKVVGITSLTWVEKGTQNINFCVPINYARGMLAYPQPLPLSALRDSTDSAAGGEGGPGAGGDVRKEYDFLLSRIQPNSIVFNVSGFSDVDVTYSMSVCTKYFDESEFRRPRLSELQGQRLLELDRSIYGTQDDEKTRYLRFAKKTGGYYLQIDFRNVDNHNAAILTLYDPNTLDALYRGETRADPATWRLNAREATESSAMNGFREFMAWAEKSMSQLLLTGGDAQREYDLLLNQIQPNFIIILVNRFDGTDSTYFVDVCTHYFYDGGFRSLSKLQGQRLVVLDREIYGAQDDDKTRYLRFAKKTGGYYLQADFRKDHHAAVLVLYDPNTLEVLYRGETRAIPTNSYRSARQVISGSAENGFVEFKAWVKKSMPQLLLPRN